PHGGGGAGANLESLQKQGRAGRPHHRRGEQRIFLRGGVIDFVASPGPPLPAIKIRSQHSAINASGGLNRDNPFGGHPKPVRYRRLGNAYLPCQLTYATSCTNRFL